MLHNQCFSRCCAGSSEEHDKDNQSKGMAERAVSGRDYLVKGYNGGLENCGQVREGGRRRLYHCCF